MNRFFLKTCSSSTGRSRGADSSLHCSLSKPWCNAATRNETNSCFPIFLYCYGFHRLRTQPTAEPNKRTSVLWRLSDWSRRGRLKDTGYTSQDLTTTLHHTIRASQKAENITDLTMWEHSRSDISFIKAVKFCKILLCTHWNLAAGQHRRPATKADSPLNKSFSAVWRSGWIPFLGWLKDVH